MHSFCNGNTGLLPSRIILYKNMPNITWRMITTAMIEWRAPSRPSRKYSIIYARSTKHENIRNTKTIVVYLKMLLAYVALTVIGIDGLSLSITISYIFVFLVMLWYVMYWYLLSKLILILHLSNKLKHAFSHVSMLMF